jgi:hypothetical protein
MLLTYDNKNPHTHHALALSHSKKAVQNDSFAELDPAPRHFRAALEINSDMEEAAQKN